MRQNFISEVLVKVSGKIMDCGSVKIRVRYELVMVKVRDKVLFRLSTINICQWKVLIRIAVQTRVCMCVSESQRSMWSD